MCNVQPFVEYKPGHKVHGCHSKEIIDKAIGIPVELRSDDGRMFHVRRWVADVSVANGVEVTGTFLVSIPEDK